MKVTFFALLLLFTALALNTPAQFNIKIPKIKTEKPKAEQPKTDASTKAPESPAEPAPRDSDQKQNNGRASGLIYPRMKPDSTPRLMKTKFFVKTVVHDSYWKMPKETDYSSWVPEIQFFSYFDNSVTLNYRVDYFNPDGTPWYSEKMTQSNQGADQTVSFQSADARSHLDTKSTAGTGVYGFKIVSENTNETVYQGKFKVGKFSRAYRPAEKNKADFYVDHDWLLPFAMVGFHHSISEIGGMPIEVSFWLKGDTKPEDLEARVFYKGQQIASTTEKDGVSSASDYETRTSEYAAARNPSAIWKRWRFQWHKLRFDNNGTFDREIYPTAHFADKNPGDYTVKVFQKGAQIREMTFTVGADGKLVQPAYTKDIFLPYYRIVLPAKVTDAEKWNQTAWKTEAFYGNPLNGLSVQ